MLIDHTEATRIVIANKIAIDKHLRAIDVHKATLDKAQSMIDVHEGHIVRLLVDNKKLIVY